MDPFAAPYASPMQPVHHAEPVQDEEPRHPGDPARPHPHGGRSPRTRPPLQRAPGWYRRSVVLVIVAALSARGVVFRGPVDEEGSLRLAFFTDPDGNELYLAELSR